MQWFICIIDGVFDGVFDAVFDGLFDGALDVVNNYAFSAFNSYATLSFLNE
jgi:hypothetical protein